MHKPVLLKEIIEYLDPKPGDCFIDATLNGGGHSEEILKKIGPDGKVLGIEIDPELIAAAMLKIENEKIKNLILVNDSYVNIKNIVREYNFRPKGILFDLGLSSWHLENSGRGFSFRRDEPLDMRFNAGGGKKEESITAAEIVNTYSKEELEKIFRECGEEQFSKQIAGNIVLSRKDKPMVTTRDLVEVIRDSVPAWYKEKKIPFATKTLQALRMTVNDELKNIEKGVSSAIEVLEPACPEQGRRGGRLAVISFHGLEDKTVRELFKKKAKEGEIRFVVKGTIRPSWDEIKNNPRARSSKLKIVEKITGRIGMHPPD